MNNEEAPFHLNEEAKDRIRDWIADLYQEWQSSPSFLEQMAQTVFHMAEVENHVASCYGLRRFFGEQAVLPLVNNHLDIQEFLHPLGYELTRDILMPEEKWKDLAEITENLHDRGSEEQVENKTSYMRVVTRLDMTDYNIALQAGYPTVWGTKSYLNFGEYSFWMGYTYDGRFEVLQ